METATKATVTVEQKNFVKAAIVAAALSILFFPIGVLYCAGNLFEAYLNKKHCEAVPPGYRGLLGVFIFDLVIISIIFLVRIF